MAGGGWGMKEKKEPPTEGTMRLVEELEPGTEIVIRAVVGEPNGQGNPTCWIDGAGNLPGKKWSIVKSAPVWVSDLPMSPIQARAAAAFQKKEESQ